MDKSSTNDLQQTVTAESNLQDVVTLVSSMIGDEFKTARQHLLDHLEGCIAWKDPAQAERQKERLREKREAERQQTQASPEEAVPETEMEAEDEQSPAFTMSM